MAVPLLVGAVERSGEVSLQRHRELERLAAVAQIGRALGGQLAGLRERAPVRDDAVAAFVSRDEAERRQDARRLGNEHGLDVELLRERAGVERPRAAERDEREVARIVTALDRDDA